MKRSCSNPRLRSTAIAYKLSKLYFTLLFTVFFCVCAVFAIEREQAGLRRICGYGVTITRGAASAMMFTYASLLVTMCRNIITFLRDTFLHLYIPFDDAVTMHKFIAFWAAVFTRQYLTWLTWLGYPYIGHIARFSLR